MKLGQVAIRIRAQAIADFGTRVFGTVEFGLAQEYTIKEESAFVIPLLETAPDNQYDTSINQLVTERIGVVVAIKNDADTNKKLGMAAFDRLFGIRKSLWKALLGWIPTDADQALVYYKGGRLLDINPAWLWYQFEFQQALRITDVDGVVYGPFDDFLKVYTQWLTGDATQAILPMTGLAPQLPESLVAPDFSTIINFKYPYGSSFGTGYDTLETEASK